MPSLGWLESTKPVLITARALAWLSFFQTGKEKNNCTCLISVCTLPGAMFEDVEKRIGSALRSIQQLERRRWGRVLGRSDSDRASGDIV